MKSLAAVARLELERTWLLLPLALAFGCAPFAIAPFVDAPYQAVLGAANPLAVLFAMGTAILLGTTSIAGDLGAGRLGFYFARPLPWWAIWGGKLLTAVALTFATGLLVLTPSALFGRGGDHIPARLLTTLVVTALLLIGVFNWGSVAARSRSAWLLLDLVALPLLFWGASDALRRVFELQFFPSSDAIRLILGLLAVAALAAGAAQMAIGRTAARRSHAAASLTGWTLVAVLVCSLQVFSRVGFATRPQGLDAAWVMMLAPTGDTALFAGSEHVLGFGSSFGQRFVASPYGIRHMEPFPWNTWGFAFSDDGTHAAWLQSGDGEEIQIFRQNLATGETTSVPADSAPPWRVRPRRVLADPTAQRVAILRVGSTSVFDATTGALLARLEDGDTPVEYLLFREGRADLVFRSTPDGRLLIETLSGGEATPSGVVEAPAGGGGWSSLHVDGPGARLLVCARGEARLVDAETGEIRATFEGDPSALLEGLLLSDGSVVIAAADPAGTALRHHGAAGPLLGELDLGPAHSVRLIEAAGGFVVAALTNPGAARTAADGPASLGERLAVVRMEPLQLVREEEGLQWRPAQGPWLAARRDRPTGGQLMVTRVLSLSPRQRSSLLRYDVATGETAWVAGTRE